MIENIRISFRHLWQNKLFSLINILGLSLGLSACFILLMHVRFERGYDRIHTRADRIVRVLHKPYSFTPMVMSGVLPDFFPEIESVVRISKYDWTGFYIKKGEDFIREQDLLTVDSTFFRIFSFDLITGDTSRILRSPDRILMSESMARKYFGAENPVGKTLSMRLMYANHDFLVEGVFHDFPQQSHFHASFLLSMKFREESEGGTMTSQWGANSVNTYLLLKEPAMMESVEARMPAFIKKYVPADFAKDLQYALQPLKNIHLYSTHLEADIEPQGSITRVIIFASIAVLVLVVAVVNFVLLSLAISYQRIREFGIRKVVGARWGELARLVSTEFLIVFILAAQIALMVVELAIPLLQSRMGFRVTGGVFSNAGLLLLFLGAAFLLGYLASIYITLQVLRIRPVDALKSRLQRSSAGITSRGAMVVFQFSIMIILMISLLVIHKQMWLIRHKDLGFRRDQLITIDIPYNSGKKYLLLRDALKKVSGIKGVAGANYLPPTDQWWITYMKNSENGEMVELEEIQGDVGIIETLGIEIIQGRSFSTEFGNDTLAMLISESGLKSAGLAKPFDSYLVLGEKDTIIARRHIIGVFRDFHIRSLYEKIHPMAIFLNTSHVHQLAVRIDSRDAKAVIAMIKRAWSEVFPDDPIQFAYTDEALHLRYQKEDQSQIIIASFALLSLFIAMMGLFGLSTYTLERRTKEIGIRLVNGAGLSQIFLVLSKQFLVWTGIAFIIASPLSWFVMQRWLQHFAYRTEISWWVFPAALALSLLVAGATIAWQIWRAANRNPVEALRYE